MNAATMIVPFDSLEEKLRRNCPEPMLGAAASREIIIGLFLRYLALGVVGASDARSDLRVDPWVGELIESYVPGERGHTSFTRLVYDVIEPEFARIVQQLMEEAASNYDGWPHRLSIVYSVSSNQLIISIGV